jgi:hypothetical protein
MILLLPDETGIAEAERLIGGAAAADRAGHKVPNDIEVPFEELVDAETRLTLSPNNSSII